MTDFQPLTNIDQITAQEELNDKMFAHYLLGRCLAMEDIMKEMIKALPATKRAPIVAKLAVETDIEMRATVEADYETMFEAKRYVTKCGYVHTMLMAGL